MTHPSGTERTPAYRLIVLPFLRRFGGRFFVKDWLAITIWRFIFAWRPLDKAELAHEVQHVRQWQANGLRFVPRYLAASRAGAAKGGDGYRDNRFEVEAREAADAVRKASASSARAGPRERP